MPGPFPHHLQSLLPVLGCSGPIPFPTPVPAASTGTFWVHSFPIPRPCCQHWDILLPPLPLSSPSVSLPSLHHGVTGSSCHWSHPGQKQQPPTHGLPVEFPVPDASPVQRSRTGPSQALPSTSGSHTGTPGGTCPSPTLPGKPASWWVGSGSLSGSGGHAGTHEVSTLLYLPR